MLLYSTLLTYLITTHYVRNTTGLSPIISCFTGFWSRTVGLPMNYVPQNVPAKSCDILVYAFVTVNPNTWKIDHRHKFADIEQGGFRQSVALKEQNPALKVILAVGGQPYNGVGEVILYSHMMAESSRRQIFVESAVQFLQTYGFDGLELHWYYPGSRGGSAADKDNFLLLVQELSTAFEEGNFSLIATVPFLKTEIAAGYRVAELHRFLTYFHVRTVEMNVYDKKHTDNSSPLRRRSFDVPGTQESEENVDSVLQLYTSMGVPREKLIFGIPFEHHVFQLKDPAKDYLKAPAISLSRNRGPFSNLDGLLYHHEVCKNVQSGKWIPKRDRETRIPYAVNYETGEWVSYEDQTTLTDKVQYVKQEGYGGVFLWLLEHDDFRGVCGEKHRLLHTVKRLMMKPSQ